jgi:hypothetical protein
MRHLARSPKRRSEIDGKSNAASRRRAARCVPKDVEEAAA